MSKQWMLALALSATVGLAACGSDDDDGTGPAQQDEIVGTWVSAGANVAPGMKLSNYPGGPVDSIRATFNANNTYTVLSYASGSSQPVTLSGSYQVGTGARGSIRTITANQTQGSVVAQGIFQVTGNTMKYEVIQTTPHIGAAAPNVTEGFGSTTVTLPTGPVKTGPAWIQTYVKR